MPITYCYSIWRPPKVLLMMTEQTEFSDAVKMQRLSSLRLFIYCSCAWTCFKTFIMITSIQCYLSYFESLCNITGKTTRGQKITAETVYDPDHDFFCTLIRVFYILFKKTNTTSVCFNLFISCNYSPKVLYFQLYYPNSFKAVAL